MAILMTKNRYYIAFAIVILLIISSYLPTFTGGFLLDDRPLIEKNQFIKKPHSISSYLIQEDGITDKNTGNAYHTGYYRPLINYTYRIDYLLWGMTAYGFRVTNLILHIIACFFLFKVMTLLEIDRLAAILVTSFFALHPVNTESVSWVISRNNVLVTLFVLFSFYFYVKGWKNGSFTARICALIAFIGAIFSKEFGLMALPIFFLYHRFISQEKRNIFGEFVHYLPFVLVLICYFVLRKNVTGALVTPFDATEFWPRIYFLPYLLMLNLKFVIFPYSLHYFYVTYPSSFFQWQSLLSVGLFIITALFFWNKRKNRLLIFSGLSFLVCLFPVLNLIPSASTSVTLIAMRWLYLPTAFLCIGFASIVQGALIRSKVVSISVLVVLTIYFGLYTHVLNRNLWHNELTFFEQEVLRFGNHFLAGDLAEKYFQKGRYFEAEKYFSIAIEKFPKQSEHYLNYSALLTEVNKPKTALALLRRAKPLLKTGEDLGKWHNNMGMALFQLGNRNAALRNFKKAVIFIPDNAIFWANLGGAYGALGETKKSIESLRKGLVISPDLIQLRANLAISWLNLKEYEKALEILERIPLEERRSDKKILNLITIARKGVREPNSSE